MSTSEGVTMRKLNIDWAVVVALAFVGLCIGVVVWAIHHESVEPQSGTVTKLQYYPAYTTNTCNGVPPNSSCTPAYNPECYRVIYDGDEKGTWGDACVPPMDWSLYKIGSRYPVSK